jgi:hypothetical protein
LCVQWGGRKPSECVIIWSIFSFSCFILSFCVCVCVIIQWAVIARCVCVCVCV